MKHILFQRKKYPTVCFEGRLSDTFLFSGNQRLGLIFSMPPMKGRRTSGMMMEPSSC